MSAQRPNQSMRRRAATAAAGASQCSGATAEQSAAGWMFVLPPESAGASLGVISSSWLPSWSFAARGGRDVE
eukprot:6216659-Prymnesium_polylepis.1